VPSDVSIEGIMKRSIILEGLGTELELSKVTAVDIDKQVIYLEQMKDGKWRLTYTKSLIPDITQLEGLRLKREDS